MQLMNELYSWAVTVVVLNNTVAPRRAMNLMIVFARGFREGK
jgi:hypothetical protein